MAKFSKASGKMESDRVKVTLQMNSVKEAKVIGSMEMLTIYEVVLRIKYE